MNFQELIANRDNYLIYLAIIGIIAYLIYQINTKDYTINMEYFRINNIQPFMINIKNFQFNPNYLQIPAGTNVVWINLEDIDNQNQNHIIHDITEVNGLFQSPDLKSNQSFTLTFQTPGTYHYYCSHHPQMKGTIEVVRNLRN